jgi:hypothetical protein
MGGALTDAMAVEAVPHGATTAICARTSIAAPMLTTSHLRERRHIRVIRQANVRQAVDRSSPVISQLQEGQCYVIDGCQDSQWGPRCKIHFHNGVTGYTIKYDENNDQNFVAFLNRG